MDNKNKNNILKGLKVDTVYDYDCLKNTIDQITDDNYDELHWFITNEDFIAYILYTSGTTGLPKGVVMPFHSVYNTFSQVINMYNINSNDIVMNLAKWSFDLSIFDFFCSFFLGATMVCVSDAKNVQEVHRVMIENKVTIWNSTPQVAGMYIRYVDFLKKSSNDSLSLLLISGDKFEKNICDLWRKQYKKTKINSCER